MGLLERRVFQMATAAVLWVVYDVYGVYVLRVVNIFPIRDAETREKSWIVTSWFGNKQHQVGYVGSFFFILPWCLVQ